MNLPPDLPLLRFVYWLVNTPGIGGLAVIGVVITCVGSFAAALRWIARGGQAGETATYAYPTPTLIGHKE